MLSTSENDFFDHLISAIKIASRNSRGHHLLQALTHYSDNLEVEIEKLCDTNHHEFTTAVNKLSQVREGTVQLTSEILDLNQSIQSSTETLATQKRALVECRRVRQNIAEATQGLKDCLKVLRLAHHVHDLLGKRSYYAALRALDELQKVHLRDVSLYKISEVIQSSIPTTKKMIAEAVMTDLNTWLFRIRETSQFLGEFAFYNVEQRRSRQKERIEQYDYLSNFKLNSTIELVSDETFEFDFLNNEDVQVDFTPLFECLHIHNALGQLGKFRADYAATRRQQKDLLMPATITLIDPEGSSLSELLEGITGFAIIEKATINKSPDLRTMADVSF